MQQDQLDPEANENACPAADAHKVVARKRIHQYCIADQLAILQEVSNGLAQVDAIRKYNIRNRTFFRDWGRLLNNPVSKCSDLAQLKRRKTSHAGPDTLYPEICALIECTIEAYSSIYQLFN